MNEKQLKKMIKNYVIKKGNKIEDIMHIILDDGNVSDGHIRDGIVDCEELKDKKGKIILETLFNGYEEEERELLISDIWGE